MNWGKGTYVINTQGDQNVNLTYTSDKDFNVILIKMFQGGNTKLLNDFWMKNYKALSKEISSYNKDQTANCRTETEKQNKHGIMKQFLN